MISSTETIRFCTLFIAFAFLIVTVHSSDQSVSNTDSDDDTDKGVFQKGVNLAKDHPNIARAITAAFMALVGGGVYYTYWHIGDSEDSNVSEQANATIEAFSSTTVSSNGFMVSFAAVAILLVVLALGYYLYSRSNKEAEENDNKKSSKKKSGSKKSGEKKQVASEDDGQGLGKKSSNRAKSTKSKKHTTDGSTPTPST